MLGCVALSVAFVPACGDSNGSQFAGTGGDGGASGGGSSGASGGGCGLAGCADGSGGGGSSGSSGCTNLQCQVHTCSGGSNGTTLSGQVFDPAGRNPLYNVVVYIPNAAGGALDTIPIGVGSNSCSCGALFSGDPIAYGLTDTDGKFTLNNVPDGPNIPLVVQIGKWRKEIVVPSITQCGASNSAGKITLPKNLQDGKYASMPNIAVSTGQADTLECLLTRVGVDESVFKGDPTGPGVHVFQGSGGNAAPGSQSSPSALWDSQADLMQYDIVMLSCEGAPTSGVDATTASYRLPTSAREAASSRSTTTTRSSPITRRRPGRPTPSSRTSPTGPTWAIAATTNRTTRPSRASSRRLYRTASRSPKARHSRRGSATWARSRQPGDCRPLCGRPRHGDRDSLEPGDALGADGSEREAGRARSTLVGHAIQPTRQRRGRAGVLRTRRLQRHARVWLREHRLWDQPGGAGRLRRPSALSADEDAIEFILFDLSSCITPVGFTPQPPQEGGIQ